MPPHDDPFSNPDQDRDPDTIPEAERILLGLLSDLPEEADKLVVRVMREIETLEEQTDSEVAAIREESDERIAAAEDKFDRQRRAILAHAIEQLEPLQKDLFRAGELGQALSTFVQIQALKAKSENAIPDPGNLKQLEKVGKSYRIRVTGSSQGPVWGSGPYTSDSRLAAAVVHAGIIEVGEETVVRVTMVDMAGQPVKGSFRNGISSMDWGNYLVGYTVSTAGEPG